MTLILFLIPETVSGPIPDKNLPFATMPLFTQDLDEFVSFGSNVLIVRYRIQTGSCIVSNWLMSNQQSGAAATW